MGGRVEEEEYYKKSEKKEARNRAENYTGGKTCTLSGTFVEPSPHVTSLTGTPTQNFTNCTYHKNAACNVLPFLTHRVSLHT